MDRLGATHRGQWWQNVREFATFLANVLRGERINNMTRVPLTIATQLIKPLRAGLGCYSRLVGGSNIASELPHVADFVGNDHLIFLQSFET
ncbi:hypothetical protein AVEN_19213-1 [Araneus ventricosus]|uniref:Uncharacterized protein n=1 Tax=Araneus ventricosus TaxID=182803 RepID=A0A4Y2SHH2_ARAVE|nr:hypothetical protein AVEN_19213-1 [Araneus ventricosus]